MFRNTEMRRITASLLVLVMMITSLPLSLLAYATEPTVPDGIGVVNTAHTSSAEDRNSYRVEFYKDNNGQLQKLRTIPEINDLPGYYIDADGYFTVPANAQVNLLDSQNIKTLINNNNILQVKITFVPRDNNADSKNYLLYSSTPGKNAVNPTDETETDISSVVYTLIKQTPKMDENNQPVVEPVYDEDHELIGYETVMEDHPLTASDYNLSTFVSTELYEHEVDVYWHDTGVDRPVINKIDILQDGNAYDVNKTDDSPLIENSNLYVYKYEVPKYAENGDPYNYTTSETMDYTMGGKS